MLHTILLSIALLDIGTLSVGAAAGGVKWLLPWEEVAVWIHRPTGSQSASTSLESQRPGGPGPLQSCLDPNGVYAFEPDERPRIPLCKAPEATGASPGRCQVRLLRCQRDGIWKEAGSFDAVFESDKAITLAPIRTEGLYRVETDSIAQESPLIIANDWKKDLLSFCLTAKRAIEEDPDERLIRSSVAISHFEAVLERVTKAPRLSRDVLLAFAAAMDARKQYDTGLCPGPVIGAVTRIRLRRFPGARIQDFAVYVPPSHDVTRKWPIYLRPDPRRWSMGKYGTNDRFGCYHEGMIDVWWFTLNDIEPEWDDYLVVRDMLIEKLNGDPDRQYIYGLCESAFATIALVLQYPDQWAQANLDDSTMLFDVAGNGLNLSIQLTQSRHAGQDSFDTRQNLTRKLFQYYGCPNVRDRGTADISGDVPTGQKARKPPRVRFTTDSLGRASAYWISIDGRVDENVMGTIDASVQGQQVQVTTANVDAYTLQLGQAPIDVNRPVEIIENGQLQEAVQGPRYVKRAAKYEGQNSKSRRLHGPISDVFCSPYTIVWGTHTRDQGYIKQSIKLSEAFAFSSGRMGGPRCADSALSEEAMKDHNLVLIGTPDTNTLLSKIQANLPVGVRDGAPTANGRSYPASDWGFFLIYPNPDDPHTYVAVFSGNSVKALEKMPVVYERMQYYADVCIYEVSAQGEIRYHVYERFGTTWKWHADWDRTMFHLRQEHPNWQWRQWTMRVTREHFGADAVICDDPIAFSYRTPHGAVCWRDLSGYYQNQWLVKIRIKGRMLKDLLTVVFQKDKAQSDGKGKEVLLVDGIKYVKLPGDTKSIGFNEVEAEREYSLVIPSYVLNRFAMGTQLVDYELLDRGELLCILREHLGANGEGPDVDGELNSTQLGLL